MACIRRFPEWRRREGNKLCNVRNNVPTARGEAVNVFRASSLYNIIDGMEGDVFEDPESVFLDQRLKNGWKNSGLPWTYHLNPERMRLPKRQ